MLNLRAVDLNLLPVFEAAYEERSLSKAAVRLAITQSAVSQAIARLRVLFRDDLFVRHARGVTPTPAANEIYAGTRTALGLVRETVAQARGFDPGVSERRFSVAIPHPLGPMIAVSVLERLRQSAPRVTVEFSTRSRPVDLERSLADGRVDMAVDWVPSPGPRFRELPLFRDSFVLAAREGHPALRESPTPRSLARHRFVRFRPRVDYSRFPEALGELGKANLHYHLEVSEILEVLMVAGQSDMIGVIPASLAECGRKTFGLQVIPRAPHSGQVPVKLVWHEGRDKDAGHRYLRRLIQEAARDNAKG
jgi:LysR family transcriptional activator for leuABCD operon